MAEGTPPDRREPEEPAGTDDEIRALARQVGETVRGSLRPTRDLTTWEHLRHEDFRQDMELRRKYAKRMLWILGAELSFVNGTFFLYTWLGVHWKIPGTTMQVWLSSTVVQVVGIVFVVTRYLFPRRDYRS
jgi:hypothetical protein